MRNLSIRDRCARPITPVIAIWYVVIAPSLFFLSAEAITPTARAEALRWKLSPGETLHYTVDRKQVQNVKVMGKEKKSTRTDVTNLSWTVKALTASGDAEIGLRFDRVRIRIEQPPFMPIEFDSSPEKTDVPDEFQSAERQIKALVGPEFSFTLRPTGEVFNLQIPAQMIKNLKDAAPDDAGGQGMISEQNLKELLLQSSPPTFPASSLESGQVWSSKPSKMPIPGLGSLTVEQVFTFLGPDPKTPALLLVGIEAKIALAPAENVAAKIRTQEAKGSLTFDSAAGRIVNNRSNQKLEMTITDRGQEIVQSTETTSAMTLTP
jgi:hypothetical protein